MKRRFALFGRAREAILHLLYNSPDQDFYVRELSRRTGIALSGVQSELKNLVQAGLIVKRNIGHQVLYSADQSSPIFSELQSILLKTSGAWALIAESLNPLHQHLASAFIFGSFAAGKQTSNSDIDVMLIGDHVGLGESAKLLGAAERELGREIDPVVFDLAQFRKEAATSGFLQEVISGPKIFLLGDERELKNLAGK